MRIAPASAHGGGLQHAHAVFSRESEQDRIEAPTVHEKPRRAGQVGRIFVPVLPSHHRPAARADSSARDSVGSAEQADLRRHAAASNSPKRRRAERLRSASVTRWPSCESRIASAAPAGPPPMTKTPVRSPALMGPVTRPIGALPREAQIGFETVMEPAANVVAGRPAPADHLVVATAAAQITSPAALAWFLSVHMARLQPIGLPAAVDPC